MWRRRRDAGAGRPCRGPGARAPAALRAVRRGPARRRGSAAQSGGGGQKLVAGLTTDTRFEAAGTAAPADGAQPSCRSRPRAALRSRSRPYRRAPRRAPRPGAARPPRRAAARGIPAPSRAVARTSAEPAGRTARGPTCPRLAAAAPRPPPQWRRARGHRPAGRPSWATARRTAAASYLGGGPRTGPPERTVAGGEPVRPGAARPAVGGRLKPWAAVRGHRVHRAVRLRLLTDLFSTPSPARAPAHRPAAPGSAELSPLTIDRGELH